MKKREIKYKDVMDLGANDEFSNDQVYFNEFGFHYSIVTIDLTKRVSIDYSKEDGRCRLLRCDKDGNIQGEIEIETLECLKKIVNFYKDKPKNYTYANVC